MTLTACLKGLAAVAGKENYKVISTEVYSSRRAASYLSCQSCVRIAVLRLMLTKAVDSEQGGCSKIALFEEVPCQASADHYAVLRQTTEDRTAAALHSAPA